MQDAQIKRDVTQLTQISNWRNSVRDIASHINNYADNIIHESAI